MDELHQKLENLKSYLKDLGSVAVAFSSGVDSTFLLKVAHDVLGEKAIAITANANAFPRREMQEADDFCTSIGVRHITFDIDVLQIPGFSENPKNRCYVCKMQIFKTIKIQAATCGIANICEGSNVDDLGDYRPGLKAIDELGIFSPLRTANLTKADIRKLSFELNLPTWSKPSFACLASRFPYGETISAEKILMVECAEQHLLDLGFKQFRVRIHGATARIEVLPDDFEKLLTLREKIIAKFKQIGFSYISMDLQGYRTGSMNEVL